MARNLLNFVLFQAAWFACVLAAAKGLWLIPPLAAAIVVAVHLSLSTHRKAELRLIALVTLLGLAVDLLLIAFNVLTLAQPSAPFWPIHALWFASLWAAYATTLNASLRWLQGRFLLAALFGAVGGPLAYVAGQKLGAITLPRATTSLILIAIEWALLMPPLVLIAARSARPRANP